MYLTKTLIEQYQTDGAIFLKNVISKTELAALAEGIETNRKQQSPYAENLTGNKEQAVFFNDYCNWQKIPVFKWFIFNSKLADIVQQLMQTDTVTFYHEHVLVKDAGNQKATPWHHDQPYYPINGKQLCSVWLPLDVVDINTSLKFIKGSHNWGKLFMPRKFANNHDYPIKSKLDNNYEPLPDIDAQLNDYDILSFAVNPGDCIVFHGACLHSASGNNTQYPRRAFATRWLGDDTRFATRPWDISPPITGGLKVGDKMACDAFPQIR